MVFADMSLLRAKVLETLGDAVVREQYALEELTVDVRPEAWLACAEKLQAHAELSFEQCLDLCAVDYSDYGQGAHQGPRFAVVVHLLSLAWGWRLRLRAWVADDAFPVLPSLSEVWPSVVWYEREAFDLFGVMFAGHPDLRRILTDYGFSGHPFRKDFPVSGYVEMRYDPEQGRVIYQPVSIEPRENVPRIIREEHYGG